MNKILVDSTHIEVHCDRNDIDTQSKLAQLYPTHCNRIHTIYKLSPHRIIEVLALLRNITAENIEAAPKAIQDYFYKEVYIRSVVSDLTKNGPRESCIVSDKLTLKPHQQMGREIAHVQDRFAFFFDTRTGKTPLSLSIIHDDIVQPGNTRHKWLIVAPLILIENAWLEDSAKFFPEISIVNCHAATKTKRLKAMQELANIYVTNTESFVNYREYFENMAFIGCFVDESSDMKSNKSKVSKELVDFAQTLKRFYLLSGTPAPNGEYEYYMQMRAIDYYAWHQSYAQFKEHYFVNLSYNPQFEKLALRPDRRDELNSKIKESAVFVDKSDVLNLPGRAFYPVEYDMPKELMKHYRKLKNDLYVEIQNNTVSNLENIVKITASNIGAKLNKLNQVSSGFIMDTKAAKENKFYGSELAEWYLLDNWRFEALKEILNKPDNAGEQVLIWANYRREFELIIKTLGEERCRCVYGGVNLAEKSEAIKLFKAGKVQYLIANPASADKGLTLTNCHICVYFSLNWSYELFKQSYDRIYADKSIQPHFCRYYVMLAKGTIDEILYHDVLANKGTASYAVLDHLKPEVLI